MSLTNLETLIDIDQIFVRLGLDADGDWVAEAGDAEQNLLGTTVLAFGKTREMALAELVVALWNIIQMQTEAPHED
jgi:predicted RNase H-like HicB family nuclease